MSTIDDVESASDLDLLMLARGGRSDALAELWRRHYSNALRMARRWTSNPHDAEDIASEAFSRMLAAVSDGGGPNDSVGGYLATAVRNVVVNRARRHDHGDLRTPDPEIYAARQSTHANPVAERAELGMVREAIATLPIRWRIVLWRTAVDRDSNRVIAQEMGMTANAVAALAVRARAGLRAAYLQAHVSHGSVAPDCQPFVVLLPALASGGRPSTALSEHLDGCARCRERADELREVERHLGAMVLPAVLVAAWTKVATLAASAVPGGRFLVMARSRGLLMVGAGGLATVAIVGAASVDPEPAPAPGVMAWGPSPTSRVSHVPRTPAMSPTKPPTVSPTRSEAEAPTPSEKPVPAPPPSPTIVIETPPGEPVGPRPDPDRHDDDESSKSDSESDIGPTAATGVSSTDVVLHPADALRVVAALTAPQSESARTAEPDRHPDRHPDRGPGSHGPREGDSVGPSSRHDPHRQHGQRGPHR